MREATGWTIFGSILVICIALSILVGIHLTYKGKTNMAKEGLQECPDIGTNYYMWQRECRR